MSVSSDSGPGEDIDRVAEDEPEPLSRDKIFHILQTQRRRDALRFLKNTDGPVEMRNLAEQVAAWENDTTIQALASDERQRVYIALYQSHLPKLDSEGVIKYNKSRGIVERGPLAVQFDPYLEASHTMPSESEPTTDSLESIGELPWLSYYRRVTAAGLVLISAAWLGVSPFSKVPDIVWGGLLVATFATLSLAQILTNDE